MDHRDASASNNVPGRCQTTQTAQLLNPSLPVRRTCRSVEYPALTPSWPVPMGRRSLDTEIYPFPSTFRSECDPISETWWWTTQEVESEVGKLNHHPKLSFFRSLTAWRRKLEHMSTQTSATCTMCAQENIGWVKPAQASTCNRAFFMMKPRPSGTAVLRAQCSAPRVGSACSR